MRPCLTVVTRLSALFFWFILSTSVTGQTPQWQKTNLDAAATALFPAAASASTVKGQQAFSYKDEQALFFIIVQKAAFRADANNTDAVEFCKGMLEGTLEAAGGGKVEEQRPVTVAGFQGMEAQYTTPTRPELPAVKFERVVLVNGTAYTLNYWTTTEHERDPASATARNQFFNSFEPGVTRVPVRTGGGGPSSTVLLLSGLAGAAAVLLRRRFAKPKV